jgi:hypothetical protein
MVNEAYLNREQQLGLNFTEALTNPQKFEQELTQKIVLFALATAGFFVVLNLMVFKRGS